MQPLPVAGHTRWRAGGLPMGAPVAVPSRPLSVASFLSPEATAGDGAEGLPVVQLSSAKVEFFAPALIPAPNAFMQSLCPLTILA